MVLRRAVQPRILNRVQQLRHPRVPLRPQPDRLILPLYHLRVGHVLSDTLHRPTHQHVRLPRGQRLEPVRRVPLERPLRPPPRRVQQPLGGLRENVPVVRHATPPHKERRTRPAVNPVHLPVVGDPVQVVPVGLVHVVDPARRRVVVQRVGNVYPRLHERLPAVLAVLGVNVQQDQPARPRRHTGRCLGKLVPPRRNAVRVRGRIQVPTGGQRDLRAA